MSRPVILDLQCGHGALLTAAAITAPRQDTRLVLGVDIDPTACIRPVQTQTPPARSVIQADCTKFLPLLIEAKATFDLILCNPPFSLRWDMRAMRKAEWRMVAVRSIRNPYSAIHV